MANTQLGGGKAPLQEVLQHTGTLVNCAKTLLVTFLANSWQPIFMGHRNCAKVAHDFGN